MSQTIPPTIDPAPQVPIRGTSTFKLLVDAFLTWMAAAVLQFQAVAQNVYSNALDCYNNAVAAAASAAAALGSANNAAASATAASNAANAVPWVSGAVVALNACVISQVNFRTYRRKAATGSGTIDPSSDPNYVDISVGLFPSLKVSHRAASGTNGGTSTSTSWNTRIWTTTDRNTIAGASVSGGDVTIPAGTYRLERCRSAANNADLHQAALYNVTDSANILVGSSARTGNSNSYQSDSSVDGEFTIASTKIVRLRHYITTGTSSTGMGFPVSSGAGELFGEMTLIKVA